MVSISDLQSEIMLFVVFVFLRGSIETVAL